MHITRLIFLAATITLASVSCNSLKKSQTEPGFVTWDKKFIELGPVKKGEKRTLFYEFTNTSDEPVQIEIVDACYCTTVDFPRGIIQKGKRLG